MRHRFISTTILTIALLGMLIPLTARASDGPEWIGTVTSRPAGTVGNWVIGGRTFSANAATWIQQEHGTLTTGACADVKYYISGTLNIITEIDSQQAYKCSGSGSGSGDNGSGSGSGDNGSGSGSGDNGSGSGSGDNGSGSGSGSTDSGNRDSYARVGQFPAGLVGGWVIGGASYTSTAATRTEQKNGVFAVGSCVETKFSALNGANTILEIETAADYKCNGATSTPTTSSGQSYGVLGAFPAGLVGTWTIGGKAYTATAASRIEQQQGTFFSGGCIDVKYTPNTTTALEISSTDAYRCVATSTQPQSASSKIYGLVEGVPATNPGTWTIGGGQYSATNTTLLNNTEHGTLSIGACATVEFTTSNGVNTASRISSEEPTKCNTSTYRNKIYGQVSAMPVGMYGTWTINGMVIDANATTRFERSEGSLAVGSCAEASYYVQNGVNYAEQISAHTASGCTGGTTPSLPASATATSKVYAVATSLPDSPYRGPWGIGGVSYTADAATRFEQESSAFAIGACVEARYAVSSGVNTLLKVETKPATRCQTSGAPVLRAYGAVESLPSPAGAGTWRVSGVNYSATAATQLKQEQGFFAIGAYVQVTYQVSGTTLTALSIESHVAAGDGRSVTVGNLDTRPADDTGTWVIGGNSYQGDSAISVDLNPSSVNSLAASTGKVLISSYRGLNGAQYITSIVAVTNQVYLPIIVR
ncbi:MAG: DUF5666 domain-containing protein [Chloroflexales bacterium]